MIALRFRLAFITTMVLGLAGLVSAQSPPFHVRHSDIDTTVKDPGKESIKEPRTSAIHPRASTASKDLQSIEKQTGKTNKPLEAKKTSAYFKAEKNARTPKINIRGSGETKSAQPQTRVATGSYNGRLKQKGNHGNNY